MVLKETIEKVGQLQKEEDEKLTEKEFIEKCIELGRTLVLNWNEDSKERIPMEYEEKIRYLINAIKEKVLKSEFKQDGEDILVGLNHILVPKDRDTTFRYKLVGAKKVAARVGIGAAGVAGMGAAALLTAGTAFATAPTVMAAVYGLYGIENISFAFYKDRNKKLSEILKGEKFNLKAKEYSGKMAWDFYEKGIENEKIEILRIIIINAIKGKYKDPRYADKILADIRISSLDSSKDLEELLLYMKNQAFFWQKYRTPTPAKLLYKLNGLYKQLTNKSIDAKKRLEIILSIGNINDLLTSIIFPNKRHEFRNMSLYQVSLKLHEVFSKKDCTELSKLLSSEQFDKVVEETRRYISEKENLNARQQESDEAQMSLIASAGRQEQENILEGALERPRRSSSNRGVEI